MKFPTGGICGLTRLQKPASACRAVPSCGRTTPQGQQIWCDARADGHSPDERDREAMGLRTCSKSFWRLHWSAIGMSGCFGCAAWARAHASSRGGLVARFHSNPAGKCLAERSAVLQRLPIARAIGCALRLAAHPGNTLVQLQKDFEQVLTFSGVPVCGAARVAAVGLLALVGAEQVGCVMQAGLCAGAFCCTGVFVRARPDSGNPFFATR